MGDYDGPGWAFSLTLGGNWIVRGPKAWRLAWLALWLRLTGRPVSVSFEERDGQVITFLATSIQRYRDRPLPTADEPFSHAWRIMGPASDHAAADGGSAYHCVEFAPAPIGYRSNVGSYGLLTQTLHQDYLCHPSRV